MEQHILINVNEAYANHSLADAEAWDKTKIYRVGAIVSWKGKNWVSQVLNQGCEPGDWPADVSCPAPWKEITQAPDSQSLADVEPWDKTKIYRVGAIVSWKGKKWMSQVLNQGIEPDIYWPPGMSCPAPWVEVK